MTPLEQHRHLATLQRRWAADASRDARYNSHREAEESRAGNRILAAGYRNEERLDNQFGNWRLGVARKEERLGK